MALVIARRTALGLLAVGAGLVASGLAQAQSYPTKPIRLIVPFAAGGGVDTVARILGEALKQELGQGVVIENLPGASGTRGAETAVKAEPDGYTILLASAGEIAVAPHIQKGLRYVPERDLAPITLAVRVPNVLVVKGDSPHKSVAQLIAFSKAQPKDGTYSSSGVGNPQHLAGELMNKMTGSQLLHVAYRGAAQQIPDVLAGSVTATFASYLAVASFVQNGQLHAVGVTSKERIPSLPNVPALAETPGLANFDVVNWFGLFAPAKTPPAILGALHAAAIKALGKPEIAAKLSELGSYPSPMPAAAFGVFVREETVKFKDIVTAAGIEAQ